METNSYINPWIYNGNIVTDEDAVGNVGFVYLITNNTNNRKYVGKKLFYFSKTRTVKGKKKKEKVISDYKEYYGSNRELQKDVEELGVDNFTREILYICKTKGHCSYLEAREQFLREVLLCDEYYNGVIQCRINSSHLPKK